VRTYNKVKELSESRNLHYRKLIARIKNSDEDGLMLMDDDEEEHLDTDRYDAESTHDSEDDSPGEGEEYKEKRVQKNKVLENKKSYDRKSGDSKYSESAEFDAFKNRKI
jgi:hypothetical protein